MVNAGDGDEAAGTGNRPDAVLRPRPQRPPVVKRLVLRLAGGVVRHHAAVRQGVIAVRGARVAPVGRAEPDVVSGMELAVDVVPSGVDDAAVVGNARKRLARLVPTDGDGVGAVGLHRVQRGARLVHPSLVVGFLRRACGVTAHVRAAPVGDEDDPPVGQPGRTGVVVHRVRQLREAPRLQVHLEDVVGGVGRHVRRVEDGVGPRVSRFLAGAPVEEEFRAVPGEVEGVEAAARQFAAVVAAAGDLDPLQ